MSANFRDAMRGQFEAGERRFAHDEFAEDFGTVVAGRVKRRRVVTTSAVGGGTVVAVGAIALAAMYLPRGASTPSATPAATPSATGSACVATTPSADPIPAVTLSPDATDLAYAVELPDGGTMTMALREDDTDVLDVTLFDGATFAAPHDADSNAYIFKIPELHLTVVAILTFEGDLKVSIGGVDAVVVPGTETSSPSLVVEPTTAPTAQCGDSSDVSEEPAVVVSSPFRCGFVMDEPTRTDPALRFLETGAMPVADFDSGVGPDPVVVDGEAVIPFATVRNLVDTSTENADSIDPAVAGPIYGTLTGVGIVKVADGVVVGMQYLGHSDAGVSPTVQSYEYGKTTLYVADSSYFEACPGATNTDDAQLYAVAGSRTVDDSLPSEELAYIWQPLLP